MMNHRITLFETRSLKWAMSPKSRIHNSQGNTEKLCLLHCYWVLLCCSCSHGNFIFNFHDNLPVLPPQPSSKELIHHVALKRGTTLKGIKKGLFCLVFLLYVLLTLKLHVNWPLLQPPNIR
uniref:Uncharacterized protein n=1 Tax=Micrurus spixii TaxID=129469 RepID=A0A2D4NHE8_9SAUR